MNMKLKTKINKKKVFSLIGFISLGLVAIAGIAAAFIMNYNTFSPSKPTILDDGKNIIITTSHNENYRGYRFKFQSSIDEVVVESEDNVLTAQELKETDLVVGGRYAISACYLGETEGGNSPYGKITTWIYVEYLNAPEISQDEANQKICWDAVENATYYTVYYKDQGELKSSKINELYFDYSNLAGGEKEFFVSAGSENYNFKTSDYSNTLSFNHVYKMLPIEVLSLNYTTCELTVVAQEEIDYITIYIDEDEGRVIKLLDPINISFDKYTYTVNISALYYSGVEIGVAPAPADELSMFDGEIKTING